MKVRVRNWVIETEEVDYDGDPYDVVIEYEDQAGKSNRFISSEMYPDFESAHIFKEEVSKFGLDDLKGVISQFGFMED